MNTSKINTMMKIVSSYKGNDITNRYLSKLILYDIRSQFLLKCNDITTCNKFMKYFDEDCSMYVVQCMFDNYDIRDYDMLKALYKLTYIELYGMEFNTFVQLININYIHNIYMIRNILRLMIDESISICDECMTGIINDIVKYRIYEL